MTQTETELLLRKMTKTLTVMADIYEKRFPNNMIVAEARKLTKQAQERLSCAD